MASSGMVRVLLARESGLWIAQGLDHDIAAHGKTLAEAKIAFCHAVAGQVIVALHHGDEPLADFGPAPQWYWDMFRNAEKLARDEVIYEPPSSSSPIPSLPAAYIANDLRVFA